MINDNSKIRTVWRSFLSSCQVRYFYFIQLIKTDLVDEEETDGSVAHMDWKHQNVRFGKSKILCSLISSRHSLIWYIKNKIFRFDESESCDALNLFPALTNFQGKNTLLKIKFNLKISRLTLRIGNKDPRENMLAILENMNNCRTLCWTDLILCNQSGAL